MLILLASHRDRIAVLTAVLALMTLLFVGYHFVGSTSLNGDHQMDGYSCLYLVCVAIIALFSLPAVQTQASAAPARDPFPPWRHLSAPEKPPRRLTTTGFMASVHRPRC